MADVKAKVDAAKAKIDLEKKTYNVELTTNKGPIRLQLFPDVAPGHVKNFVALAQIGFYNGVYLPPHHQRFHDSGRLSPGHRHGRARLSDSRGVQQDAA